MSRFDVARSRKPGLRDLQCTAYSVGGNYNVLGWLPAASSRETASVRSVAQTLNDTGQDTTLFYIRDPEGILGPVGISQPPDDGSPKRKCIYMQYIDTQLKGMLQAAPLNETFRARLMAKVGEMPPKEADTWDKIMDWVEFNFPKTGKAAPVKPDKEGIKIDVDMSETESGTCHYSRQLRGSDTLTIKAADILGLVEEYPDDLDSLLDALQEQVREVAYENISMDTLENSEQYERYEGDGRGDGSNLDYSTATLKERLKAFLRANLDAGQLQDLGI